MLVARNLPLHVLKEVREVANTRGPAVDYQAQKLSFHITWLLKEWPSFEFFLLEMQTLRLHLRLTGLELHFNKISE